MKKAYLYASFNIIYCSDHNVIKINLNMYLVCKYD